ncbi:class A beta-lactamase [Amycolatopsis rhabdoformis]|uniref:Beta-lactamase n=1 Tax=Amycolatopsis rhabdoformis TaxID=1448059 RepID=A0ABZ1ICA4_9PSEU|nr:class A beta-lactamase [Amycolatopsis rhabdoformis]WSE31837.1 class A beta-lactamase [Amycolatopsis rhabdoformis]
MAGRPLARRSLLVAALVAPLAGCAAPARPAATPTPTPSSRPTPTPAPKPPSTAPLAALEGKYRARLGVHALATGSGATLDYRGDERFAFCSTFKTFAVAAVLQAHPLSYLDTTVRYTRAEVDSVSPITEHHAGAGMTVRELCDAAIRYSDGTAGNLLMRDAGGPAGLTAYLRGLGDRVSRMDTYEPELNRDRPGDPRDTTTPRALAEAHRRVLLGDALPPDRRALVESWLARSTTGAQTIRAGVPAPWRVLGKTGHGDYGRVNDVAVVIPPGAPPLVLAIMSDRTAYDDEPRYALIAEAAKCVADTLH